MDNRKDSKLPYLLMAVLGFAIAVLLLYILPYHYRLNMTVAYEETKETVENPLTGYAPPAENAGDCEKTSLVYLGITWAEWEPGQGRYAIEALEEKYHIERWKKENKHAVLRFSCDVPGTEKHMDIPNWLYDKTKDGVFYESAYGQGYAPDYENAFFREQHSQAIRELADYCNQDDFVAYVELGSLGHWGEWHTDISTGAPGLPDAEVCWQYVLDYSDHFHNVRLLMRRNYIMAAEGGLGLYNDMTGHKAGTEEWLGWIADGGSFDTEGTPLAYQPMDRFWERAPVGGEMTSEYPMEELLEERLQDTLSLVEQTHMTFIGPKCPEGDLLDSPGAQTVRERLGYRISVSELRTRFSFANHCLEVYLIWNNTGLAPFYWDWPVSMYVYDADGNQEYWETIDLHLSELVPGKKIETRTRIPFTDLFRQGFQIGIGITDPDRKNTIELAMDSEEKEDVQIIYTYDK